MRRPSTEELRSMCIRERWFTCGTNAQYERMFEMLESGEKMEDVALTIAMCSEKDGKVLWAHEVMEKMEEAFPELKKYQISVAVITEYTIELYAKDKGSAVAEATAHYDTGVLMDEAEITHEELGQISIMEAE